MTNPFRAMFWRILAWRCSRIMRNTHGMPGCANPREHRNPVRRP